ncbi:MFS transporter [Vibrio hangzhouensis]|uniref:MFS transporter n=1 Tax=Vibrio hangzhouensis TaxID=462991 RepID=UPI001C93887C|nr:MFS transporter [Vibrio hangzhouensis]MBY6197205.1 MFS transporter [Vibrio hangzhouensis]
MTIFRPWYLAQMSIGVVQWVGIALMLTPLIIERTGSGALMGAVMSVIGLFGVAAPLIGWLADRFSIHRQLQKVALLSHLLSLILLYFATTQAYLYLLVGLAIGVGTVTQLVLNPAFVLNALPAEGQSRGLSRLFQLQFIGIVIAGTLIGIVSLLGWSHEHQLLVLMALVVVSILAVFIAPPPPIQLHVQTMEDETDQSIEPQKTRTTPIAFTLFLVTVFISMFTSSNLMETGPIIIKEVFGVDLGHSAFGLAASALLTIVLLEPAGRCAEKFGSYAVWIAALVSYAITAIGLWLAVGTTISGIVPILLIMLLMQAISWFDMAIPAIADGLSPSSPALTQGLLLFAMAGGFGVGTFIAGQLIETDGFVAVIDYCAASIIVTLILAGLMLLMRRR